MAASAISTDAVTRHYHRYHVVSELLLEHALPTDIIVDVGCGSGYGTEILGRKFRYVFGIEPNERARAYATKHFPKFRFIQDMEGMDVGVFVESAEHMSRAEMRCYLLDTKIAVVTTPLVLQPNNEFHTSPFREVADVELALKREGFHMIESRVEKDIVFTTGEEGDQFYGVFGKLFYK